jgi:hypothetical protein
VCTERRRAAGTYFGKERALDLDGPPCRRMIDMAEQLA